MSLAFTFDPIGRPYIRPDADGVYRGILDQHYHRWGGASKSRLSDMFGKSAQHVEEDLRELGEDASTDDMKFGSAGHIALLQPAKYEEAVHVGPVDKKTLTAWKRWEKESIRRNPWALRMKPREALEIENAVLEVDKHPELGPLIRGADDLELSCVWTRPVQLGPELFHELRMKARLDVVSAKDRIILDIKFTRDASRAAFKRTAERLRYEWQDLIHTEAAVTCLGLDVEGLEFWFGVIERATPPRRPKIAVYQYEPKWPILAYYDVEATMEQWARCERSGLWHGYPTGVTKIGYGDYYERAVQDRIEHREKEQG